MTADRGSSVLIEVEFQKNTPYGDAEYFDPSTSEINISDPEGTLKVDSAALIKSAVGKYYYICQTATNWLPGEYRIEVLASDGTYSDVTITPNGFELI